MTGSRDAKAARGRLCNERARGLPLGELVTSAGLVQPDLLALHFARVAGHESRLLEHPLQARVVLDQGAGDAVAHGARLARLAAAIDVDTDVEGIERIGQHQGLAHDHAPGLTRKKFVDGAAVDGNRALAWPQIHPRHGALAPSGTVVLLLRLHCHVSLRFPGSWVAAPCADGSCRYTSSSSSASRSPGAPWGAYLSR